MFYFGTYLHEHDLFMSHIFKLTNILTITQILSRLKFELKIFLFRFWLGTSVFFVTLEVKE